MLILELTSRSWSDQVERPRPPHFTCIRFLTYRVVNSNFFRTGPCIFKLSFDSDEVNTKKTQHQSQVYCSAAGATCQRSRGATHLRDGRIQTNRPFSVSSFFLLFVASFHASNVLTCGCLAGYFQYFVYKMVGARSKVV